MQIAIVGCGWLGLPLGLSLQKGGHSIVATRRSAAGCSELDLLGFSCVQFELGDTLTQEKLTPIFNSDLLILNIPVGRKTASSEAFSAHISALLRQAVDSNIKHVIFVSTTSVYGEQNTVVSEKSTTTLHTQAGNINLAVERLVQQYFTAQASIIRLSGLVGADRHPVNYLAGKTELAAPNKVVNLVHQQDVIQGIKNIIKHEVWGHTLVLSATEHPTRHDYYTWAAAQLNLTAPLFVAEQKEPSGKLVDPSDSLSLLNMRLKYPSPYDML